jgi:outer membrane protein assembly factor BamB
METAAIPLITAIVLKGKEMGMAVNGFYLRKSRKTTGLQKRIEGVISNEKIILVDDLMNSGSSILKQLLILEELGKHVCSVFTLVRFHEVETYTFLHQRSLHLETLFSITDLGLSLPQRKEKKVSVFEKEYKYAADNPNYFYVVPKSGPVLDEHSIYMGTDNDGFVALSQQDGGIIWRKQIGSHPRGKGIFSTPALSHSHVYFGAYDGNVYALEKETGKVQWIFREADWVGSSPSLAGDANLIFIGLEFGLFKKMGGIVALDASTGEKKWEARMEEYVHCSPAYSEEFGVVAIGDNAGNVYLFNAKTGNLLWKKTVGGALKASFVFDTQRKNLVFGSFDGNVYIFSLADGSLRGQYATSDVIWSTPVIDRDRMYFTSLDKHLYCVNLDTGNTEWKFNGYSRIFASPFVISENIYIGTTGGKMLEVDGRTGESKGMFQTSERIVNAIAFNSQTEKFFIPTYANELYCVTKQKDVSRKKS